MGTQQTRAQKIYFLGVRFTSNHKGSIYDKEKLIFSFITKNGSTRRTALEILKGFEAKGKIKIDKKTITVL